MHVDILIFRRMELHDTFVIPPKNILHKAHLVPCRAAVAQAHADMLPAPGPGCNKRNFIWRPVLPAVDISGHSVKSHFYDLDAPVTLNFGYLSHGQSSIFAPQLGQNFHAGLMIPTAVLQFPQPKTSQSDFSSWTSTTHSPCGRKLSG